MYRRLPPLYTFRIWTEVLPTWWDESRWMVVHATPGLPFLFHSIWPPEALLGQMSQLQRWLCAKVEGICSYLFRMHLPDLQEKPAQLAKASLSSSLWDCHPVVWRVSQRSGLVRKCFLFNKDYSSAIILQSPCHGGEKFRRKCKRYPS